MRRPVAHNGRLDMEEWEARMRKATTDPRLPPIVRADFVSALACIDELRKESEILAWVLSHPETAAECLEDAAAGDGTAFSNLERRIAGLTQTNAGGRPSAA